MFSFSISNTPLLPVIWWQFQRKSPGKNLKANLLDRSLVLTVKLTAFHRIKLILVAILAAFSVFVSTRTAAADSPFFLPMEDSDSWMISQAYDGITHQNNAYYGIDFWKPGIEGKPVLAAADGSVVKVVNTFTESTWPNKPYLSGNVVILRHSDGSYTQYAHLQKENITVAGSNGFVKVGDRVKRGAKIGRVGTTGASSGPHLHFQRQTGDSENSESYPVVFVDVRGGEVAKDKWYTPDPAFRDTTPPLAGTLLTPRNGDLLSAPNIVFRWTPANDEAGITSYTVRVSNNPDLLETNSNLLVNSTTEGTQNPLATTLSATLPEKAGTFYWTVVSKNPAGLTSVYQKGYFQLDTVSPTGNLVLENNISTEVAEPEIQLRIQASDTGSGVWGMVISENSEFERASWETLKARTTWRLSDGPGNKKLYARFMDRAGNTSPVTLLEIQLLPDDNIVLDDSAKQSAMSISSVFANWLM